MHKGFIALIAAAILSGCASSHHTAKVGWEDGRIRFDFFPPDAGTPVLNCLSCNEYMPPLPLQVNDHGIAYIKIEEAVNDPASLFRLTGSGIDTTLSLEAPLPSSLKDKLIGKAMILRYAMIYKDTTLTEAIGSLERKETVNLFGENDVFYYIHHPQYPNPVVILKSEAVRIR